MLLCSDKKIAVNIALSLWRNKNERAIESILFFNKVTSYGGTYCHCDNISWQLTWCPLETKEVNLDINNQTLSIRLCFLALWSHLNWSFGNNLSLGTSSDRNIYFTQVYNVAHHRPPEADTQLVASFWNCHILYRLLMATYVRSRCKPGVYNNIRRAMKPTKDKNQQLDSQNSEQPCFSFIQFPQRTNYQEWSRDEEAFDPA